MRAFAVIMLTCAPALLAGQDQRPTPEARRDMPGSEAQRQLPSITLPEFVITGIESIDLPQAEKAVRAGGNAGTPKGRPVQPAAERTSPLVGGGDPTSASLLASSAHTAKAFAGFGTFRTLTAGLFAYGSVDPVTLAGDLRYDRTTGFAAWTGSQTFALSGSARWPTEFFEPFVRSGRADVHTDIGARSYRWYGTAQPSAERSVSTFGLRAGLSGLASPGHGVTGEIGYAYAGVRDSSSKLTEPVFRFMGSYDGSVLDLPLRAWLHAATVSPTGGFGEGYGIVRTGAEVPWSPVEEFTLAGSLELATFTGQAGQKRTLVLPAVRVGFRFSEQHRFVGRYEPGVAFRTMGELTSAVPYVDAASAIRQTVYRNRGSFGVESDWSDKMRTLIEVEASKASDHPVVADTGSRGVFNVFYTDVTVSLLRASLVAKLSPNHYFSAIAILRSSKNSTGGGSVPYLPSAELRVGHTTELWEKLRVQTTLQGVARRTTEYGGATGSVPGYVRLDAMAAYRMLRQLELWGGCQNITDARIVHWSGYRETPFTMMVGLTYVL